MLALLAGCTTPTLPTGNSHRVGQPLIREPDGRITGYVDRKRFGPTCIRAPDRRFLGAVEEGPGSAPTYIGGTDSRILRQID
ncbi:hypothetical protein [Thioalkalivibrio sp. AKL12]|uniref:hypothetical protein n=1 Tax=Thioalkalivibrio sp. AKL12 TaxID=1158159 RepID=UPI00350EBEA7